MKIKERRISKPQHIRALISEQINILRQDANIEPVEKARAIGYLSNIALSAIKDGDFDDRLKEIEDQLKEG